MVDDPIVPSLEETYRRAYEAKMRGQVTIDVECSAAGRPRRAFIYVHGCSGKVMRRYAKAFPNPYNGEEVVYDVLLVRLDVVDVCERWRRECLRAIEAATTPSPGNRPRPRPRAVMQR